MNEENQSLSFTTTVIGDTARLKESDYVVVQKFLTERRLLRRSVERETAQSRSVSEFEYNQAGAVLVSATK